MYYFSEEMINHLQMKKIKRLFLFASIEGNKLQSYKSANLLFIKQFALRIGVFRGKVRKRWHAPPQKKEI